MTQLAALPTVRCSSPISMGPLVGTATYVPPAGPLAEVDGQGDTPDAALRDFVKRMRESGQAFSVE